MRKFYYPSNEIVLCYCYRCVVGCSSAFLNIKQIYIRIQTSYAKLLSGIPEPLGVCIPRKKQLTSGMFRGIPRESIILCHVIENTEHTVVNTVNGT